MNLPRLTRPLCALLAASLFAATAAPRARADELMRQVQEELRKRNLYFGDINGLYSPQVAAALRRYQQRKGFQNTGEADDTTLRSLSLVTGPVVAFTTPPTVGTPAATGATPPPATTSLPPTVEPAAAVEPAESWPDLPVLRSDQGRPNPEPPPEAADIDPTPAPVPKPPPAAGFERGPVEESVRSFLEDFLRQGESNEAGAQQDFFAERVDYFDQGWSDRPFIEQDTARYNKRWPDRRFNFSGPMQLSEGKEPGQMVVNVRCRFHVKQSDREKDPKEAKGEKENTYTLVRQGEEPWRIMAINERRVRKKKG